MSHDELTGLAAGYVLLALDDDDLQAFEAHLATCPECQAEVARMRPLVDALSMTSEEAQPANELRERIMASVRAEPRLSETTSAASPMKKAPWWRRPVLWPLPVGVLIAALVAVIAIVAVWGSQTDGDLASAQRRLNLSYEGLEIMAQADQWWRFEGSAITSGLAGTLAYSEELGRACLLVSGLPEGDEFRYQVRLTEPGGEVTVRRMWRYDNGMWLILEGDPNQLQKLEVMVDSGDSTPALIDIPLTTS